MASFRLVICGMLVPSLAGCYAAAAGIVVGIIAATDNKGGGAGNVPAPPLIVGAPRALGGDHVVLDYELFDADGGCLDVLVEWALESETPGGDPPTFRRATRHEGPVPLPHDRVAASSIETCLESPPGGFRPFVYVWSAGEDLRRLEPPVSSALVRVRITVEDGTGRRSLQVSDPIVAGNGPPRILDLEVTGDDPAERGGLVEFRVKVADSTSDRVRLKGFFFLGGDPSSKRSMTPAFGVEEFDSSPGEGREHTYVWNSILPSDLGRQFRRDVSVVIIPDDGLEEGEAWTLNDIEVDNNEGPAVDVVPLAGSPDRSFEVPVRFIVSDAEEDRVSVVLQWAPAGEPFQDEHIPLDDLELLKALISPGRPDLDPLRRELRLLREAPLRVYGFIGSPGEPGRTDRVRLVDVVRQGLVFRFPAIQGPGPLREGILTEEDGVFLIGREVTISHPAAGGGTARIVAFDPRTAEALLESAVPVASGSRYEVRLDNLLVDLWNTREGVVHKFVWDSGSDLREEGLDAAVRIRALGFDAQSQVGSWSRERGFNLESGFLVESQRLAAGSGPTAVLVEDLNRDRLNDIVVVSEFDLKARVFHQSSEGAFADLADQELRIGLDPDAGQAFSLAAGDVAGDGGPDILVAVSIRGRSVVQVFAQKTEGEAVVLGEGGAGEGEREPTLQFGVRDSPSALAIADFGGGPENEIAVASARDRKVGIFARVEGEGLDYREALALDVPSRPQHVSAGDLNSDGAADIAVCGFELGFANSFVVVFLRDPAKGLSIEAFSERRELEPLLGPKALAIGDLDSDPLKAKDLVVVFEESSKAGVFLQPLHSLQRTPPSALLRTGIGAVSVVVADFNGDGALDISTGNESSGSATLFLQGESGAFRERPAQTLSFPSTVKSVAAGDVNGDSLPDLVTTLFEAQAAVVYRQVLPGRIVWGSQSILLAGDALKAAEVCDLNGDGRQDVVALSESAPKVFVYHLQDTGILPSEPTLELDSGGAPTWLSCGDLNGDARNDLVAASREAGVVEVFFQHEEGSLGRPGPVQEAQGPDARVDVGPVRSIALGDVNGDGRTDLVAAIEGSDPDRLRIHLQDGGSPWSLSEGPPLKAQGVPILVLVEDLDQDGRKDVLSVNQEPSRGTVNLYLQDPAGSLPRDPGQILATLIQPRSASVADVNGDGRNDIIVATFSNNRIHVFHQDPDGRFGNPRGDIAEESCGYDSGSPPDHLSAGDIAGDLQMDLVVATALDNKVGLYSENRGDLCPLARVERVRLGVGPAWTAIEDLNGDGRPDVVVASNKTATLSVLLGR